MRVDKSRLNRIGIDRVVINNFTISNFEDLEKKIINTNLDYIEKLEKKHNLFHLSYSINLKTDKIYTVASLEFNPNKLRDKHNVYNSTPEEFWEQLNKLIEVLDREGINLDIANAKIKELEINTTIGMKFKELEEVMLLIGRANYRNALGMYSFNSRDIPKEIKTERSLYLNSKLDLKKEKTGKIIKFYDKSFEMLRTQNLMLDEELTRVEVLLGRDYYRTQMNLQGLTNDLKDLNYESIDKIFVDSLINEIKIKPQKYLGNLKKNLVYDFRNFKRNEKKKREERERLKELGKEIPGIYKEHRGVFEYLLKESWVFDYSYLLEVVIKEIEAKHRVIYEKQVKNKFLKLNNLEIYKTFLNTIFKDNFFYQLNQNSWCGKTAFFPCDIRD